MSFKDSYPDYIAIEKHIQRARVERSLALAVMIADAAEIGMRGLKKLASAFGAKPSRPSLIPRVSAEG
jgi:hypothetical protein